MSPDDPNAEREEALSRRLREFNRRTRQSVTHLTGRQETAETGDPR